MAGFDVGLWGAFIAGLLSFMSPCVLPLVPPYLCFIGGVSLSEMTDKAGPPPGANRRVFISALAFVLGFTMVFVLFGATASFLGQLLADNMLWIGRVAGVLIIIMGVHFLGIVKIPLLYREARFHGPAKPVGLFGAFLMGYGVRVRLDALRRAGVGGDPDGRRQRRVRDAGHRIAAGNLCRGDRPAVPDRRAVTVGPFLRLMPGIRKYMGAIERGIGVLLIHHRRAVFLTGRVADIAYWLLETFPALGKVG